jgi:hypothetical protein
MRSRVWGIAEQYLDALVAKDLKRSVAATSSTPRTASG